jgi:hypothetical protein
MSYFLILRTGLPGSLQYSPLYVFKSLEQAHTIAERAFSSKGAEYLIEGDHGPITYRLKDER